MPELLSSPKVHGVISRLYDRLSGRRVWTELRALRELQWQTPEQLEARGIAKLRPLLEHACAHVPYYRALFEQAGIQPTDIKTVSHLSRLPITSKADLRTGFPARVVADSISARRRQKGITSGSTGLPLEYYVDGSSLDLRDACALFFYEWLGCAPSDVRIRIGSGIVRERAWARLRRSAWWLLFGGRVLQLDGGTLSADQFRKAISKLSRNGRYYIASSPSYVGRLAAQLSEAGADLPAYPTVVVTGAETQSEADVAAIQRVFRCPVLNRYGSTETGYLAQTCPDNPTVLHVNSAGHILRVIRDDGAAAAPGESGRLVVTDLTNWVMPFINYDLGDRAVAGGPCRCGRGFPSLMRLEGRTGEMIRTVNGKLIPPTALGLNKVPRALEHVWEYQAVQTAPDAVVFRIVPTRRFNPEFSRELQAWLEAVLGPGMHGTIEAVSQIPAEPSGKRFIIKSCLSDAVPPSRPGCHGRQPPEPSRSVGRL
jgi:phenylacetate-CoA ligase